MPQITNTEPRVITLPGRKRGSVLVGTGVGHRLVPGANFVPDEVWAAAKTNPGVRIWIAARYLVEGVASLPAEELPQLTGGTEPDSDEPAGTPAPETLRGMRIETVRLRVLECTDRERLTLWAESENRPRVLEIIETRLAELS